MSADESTELENLVGQGRKKKGCCRSHPVLCGSTLTVGLVFCVVVFACGLAFYPDVDQEVQDAIGKVPRC